MTSRGLKGHRELEAAKQRLASTKKWKTFATDAVESTQGQLRTAQNEKEGADSFLKSVEKKWELSDVDLENDGSSAKPAKRDDGGKKKRSVSSSLSSLDIDETVTTNQVVPRSKSRGLIECCEVEMEKKRLALATEWGKCAADAAELAKSQLRAAQNEEKEAETFLKIIEKRWEVIDVDLEDDTSPVKLATKEGGCKRQRTVSLSPRPNGIEQNTFQSNFPSLVPAYHSRTTSTARGALHSNNRVSPTFADPSRLHSWYPNTIMGSGIDIGFHNGLWGSTGAPPMVNQMHNTGIQPYPTHYQPPQTMRQPSQPQQQLLPMHQPSHPPLQPQQQYLPMNQPQPIPTHYAMLDYFRRRFAGPTNFAP
mmetsp:Transcript_32487/g.62153  ORF Transcript_32487/g.62153 Transcript_32487/m.62153 type:complete len:365 (-) Transcript_32487:328-1422(-)